MVKHSMNLATKVRSTLTNVLTHAKGLRNDADVRAFLFSTPRMLTETSLRKALIILIFLRVSLLLFVLVLSGWNIISTSASLAQAQRIIIPVAMLLGVSIINALWVRNTKHLVPLGVAQLVLDVIFASLAIYVTGSHMSMMLYLLIIVGASLVFGSHAAVGAALLSGIFYSLIAGGIIPPVVDGHHPASSFEIFVAYVALTVIAVVSSYLSRQRELLDSLALEQARDLSNLSREKQQLFNDISDGIITVDLNSAILSINEAAKSIMRLKSITPDKLLGRPLPRLLQEVGLEELPAYPNAPDASIRNQELLIADSGAESEIHLNYSVRPLRDDQGNPSGRILIFRDVSHVKNIEEKLSLHEEMTRLMASKTSTANGEEEENLNESIQMIGESPVMHQVFSLVRRVATSDASVLINGESGTGKELIARAIHNQSSRSGYPFVAINCGAIPENLIESELFGHKKGAFTGAIADNPGLFRRASGGTLFLDEIGELPLQLQTKLLRVLQERTVRSVGDTKDTTVDVRIVAATNRELKTEIKAGNFREDLYYRLNVVSLYVPPLRERKEDIPLLVVHFIGKYCSPDQVLPQISPDALKLLSSYGFPGNVRELENIIERALVLGDNAVLPEHLPDDVQSGKYNAPQRRVPVEANSSSYAETESKPELPVELDNILAHLEQTYIRLALDETSGARKEAAELLGINLRSLRYRMKKYEMGQSESSLDIS